MAGLVIWGWMDGGSEKILPKWERGMGNVPFANGPPPGLDSNNQEQKFDKSELHRLLVRLEEIV